MLERFEDSNGKRWYAEDVDKYSTGECYASVTAILDLLVHYKLKDWFINTSPAQVKKISFSTAGEGSTIHDIISKDAMGDYSYNVDPKHGAAFDHWLRIKKQHNIKVIATEQGVCNTNLGYAGTYDLLGEFDGKMCVMDIKTGSQYPVTAGWQMAAYAQAIEQQGDHKDLGFVGLHIKRDGTYGKEWVYQHKEACWKAFVATWFSWKMMYYNELKRMGWKWLSVDPIIINDKPKDV